jgi:hypothetical protein
MKIDAKDFQDQCRQKFPNSWTNTDYSNSIHTIMITNDMMDNNLSYAEKHRVALIIWKDGYAVKDETGIFIPIPVVSPTVQQMFTSAGPNKLVLPTHNHGYSVAGNGGGDGSMSGTGGTYKYQIEFISDDSECKKAEKKCECGASSVGSTKHSNYCEMNNA